EPDSQKVDARAMGSRIRRQSHWEHTARMASARFWPAIGCFGGRNPIRRATNRDEMPKETLSQERVFDQGGMDASAATSGCNCSSLVPKTGGNHTGHESVFQRGVRGSDSNNVRARSKCAISRSPVDDFEQAKSQKLQEKLQKISKTKQREPP